MEGLALHFEMDFFNAEISFLIREISDEDIKDIKNEIISDLLNEDFDYKFWQNKRDKQRRVPPTFVYSFGYRIVKEYLMKNPAKNAVLLYKEPAKSFLPEYLI